jgi:diaminopimelate epimerase
MRHLSLDEFSARLASADPTPGGGSASAVAGAFGAALVAMLSRLSMGRPKFAPADVPVLADGTPPVIDFPIEVDGRRIAVSCMSIGNPHAVNFLDTSVHDYPLEIIGPMVEHHPAFPARVDYGIANVISRERMDVRVWERGAGETLACGSGCCAAMVMAHMKGLVGDKVDITQPGGLLTVEWVGIGDVYLTGPAEFIFEGEWPE